MADFNVSVTKNGVIPAVIVAGNEQTYGQTILFSFSSDWNDLTKEVIFYDLRGNTVVSWVADGVEVAIPDTVAEYGGDSKFTIRGYTIDAGYIADQLQVTGTIHYTYTAGLNPRMEGKIIPSTLDKFIYTASQYVDNKLQEAKDSGEFNGADGQNGLNGADGQDGADGTSAGFGEPSATAVHIPENAQPYAIVTASGSDTAKIFDFEFGIPGSTVRDLHILGHYASLSALQAAVPNPSVGDTYSVGSTTPYTIYVYDGVSGTWANYGPLGDGGGGGGGGTVTIDASMSSSSTNAVQNKTIKEYVDESIENAIGDIPAYQAQHTTLTLTLDADDWSGSTQTVTATGVTSSNTVIVSPAPSSIAEYSSCVVYCSAQSANSLTFTCSETPTNDITVNVAILGVIE